MKWHEINESTLVSTHMGSLDTRYINSPTPAIRWDGLASQTIYNHRYWRTVLYYL